MSLLAPLPFVLWAAFRLSRGETRWDMFAFLLVPPLLEGRYPAKLGKLPSSYYNPRS